MKKPLVILGFSYLLGACGQTSFGSGTTAPSNLEKPAAGKGGTELPQGPQGSKGTAREMDAGAKMQSGATLPPGGDGSDGKKGDPSGAQAIPGPGGPLDANGDGTLASLPGAPSLKTAFVEVPRDVLGPSATITVGWEIGAPQAALAGWKTVVEVLPQGATDWALVQEVDAAQGRIQFPWGDRPVAPFTVRVRLVKDGVAVAQRSASWLPHVFNTAVLTRSVQCLFCHLKVEGDVGGIDFPKADMHGASATGVRITGRLYGTTGIPEVFKKGVPGGSPVASGGFFENYKNTEQKVFPVAKAGGKVDFPRIDAATLASAMLGKLTGHAGTTGAKAFTIVKSHKGNVFLDGTQTPFEIAGEVFIDGDLVIKGSYKGVGTIYARNIYVIGDVKALRGPFPYAAVEADALAQARASVARGDDALHLGALSQMVVGEVETNLAGASDITLEGIDTRGKSDKPSLYEWFGKADFLSAGQKPLAHQSYINSTPAFPRWKFDVNAKTRIDVARVDAFLFSNESLVWHAHGNWVLNGGFVSPKTAMTSIVQLETGSNWCNGRLDAPDATPDGCGERKAVLVNPRNDLPTHTNVIRFDYRLRAGAPGFDSIRPLFDGMGK